MDLRVKLNPVQLPCFVKHCRHRGLGSGCGNKKTGRRALDKIPVAHPDRIFLWQAPEKGIFPEQGKPGGTVLPLFPLLHLSSQEICH
jgi:hypothetical protein